MTTVTQYMSYLLVDGALLGAGLEEMPPITGCSEWLHAIYMGEGASFGALLIDIEAVVRHEAVGQMMGLVNGRFPQLHLSYLESALPTDQLVLHLQQFRAIQTEDGRLFTLRFADNVALVSLAAVLLPAQWKALMSPIRRWSVHGRDGAARTLASSDSLEPAAQAPLLLSAAQMAELYELCAPDVMLANIRDIRHGEPLPGTVEQQYRWAVESRQVWRRLGIDDLLVLRWLTSAAIDTGGAVLTATALPQLLTNPDKTQIRADLVAHVRATALYKNKSPELSPVLSD